MFKRLLSARRSKHARSAAGYDGDDLEGLLEDRDDRSLKLVANSDETQGRVPHLQWASTGQDSLVSSHEVDDNGDNGQIGTILLDRLSRQATMPLLDPSAGRWQDRKSMRSSTAARRLTQIMATPSASPTVYQGIFGGGTKNGKPLHKQKTVEMVGDSVLFSTEIYYAPEDAGKAVIDVIRVGQLEGTCSVSYKTEDGSGKAGDKYTATSGKLVFEPGEACKHIEVTLHMDTAFNTTLDFKVCLQDADNCHMDPYLSKCSVMILDNDSFPSNQESILDGISAGGMLGHLRLMWAFLFFCYEKVPTIRWKTLVIAVLDQLQNGYYLGTVYLKVYFVDVVLRVDEETEPRLIVPGYRILTAVVLALVFILPNIILNLVQRLKIDRLATSMVIIRHLRLNIFRKYLNYATSSHTEVSEEDMSLAFLEDVPKLVNAGYTSGFNLLRDTGKMICVGIFVFSKNSQNALPLLIYPALLLIFILCRKDGFVARARALRMESCRSLATVSWACDSRHLISDYHLRPTVSEIYDKQLGILREPFVAFNIFNFWNSQFVPWITTVLVGTYMVIGTSQLLRGMTSVGRVVATMGVYGDLGLLWVSLWTDQTEILLALQPLLQVTIYLNLDIDVTERMRRSQLRLEYIKECFALRKSPSGVEFFTPRRATTVEGRRMGLHAVPIMLQKVGVSPKLTPFSAEVPQGRIVGIIGPHSSGKATLLKVITDNEIPCNGNVVYSSHLRTIYLPQDPIMIAGMTLFENLIFGSKAYNDIERVQRLIKRVGLHVSADDLTRTTKHGKPWFHSWSQTQKRKAQLIRALVFNPEILAIHKPVCDMDLPEAKSLLELLREFVSQRGLELDDWPMARRPPRTLFITAGDTEKNVPVQTCADILWWLSPKEGQVVPVRVDKGGYRRRSSIPSLGSLESLRSGGDASTKKSPESGAGPPQGSVDGDGDKKNSLLWL